MSAAEQPIVMRLRNYDECHDGDVDEAADMLEFLLGQFQLTDCKMDSQHGWRFRHGWPMNHCVGQTAEAAVKAAMREVERSRSESA